MAAYTELDHLMALSDNPQNAIAVYEDTNAINDRIMEWFETPQGTLADLPSWGHQFYALQHEPITAGLEVLMEAKIITKLAQDCGISVRGVRIDCVDIDRIDVTIVHPAGMFRQEVSR